METGPGQIAWCIVTPEGERWTNRVGIGSGNAWQLRESTSTSPATTNTNRICKRWIRVAGGET